LDANVPAQTPVRCADCSAVFSLSNASKARVATPRAASAQVPVSSGTSFVPILIIGAVLLGVALVVVAVGGVGAYFLFRGRGASGSGSPGLTLLGVNPAVNQAALKALQPGMTLDQVQAILGPGRTANTNDFRDAFAGFNDDAAKWSGNSTSAGVTSWYHWQIGDERIFVGFAKGRRTGKLRANVAFWVRRWSATGGGRGYDSDVGFLISTVFGDPDDLVDKRK
jgi:hypothetical protein